MAHAVSVSESTGLNPPTLTHAESPVSAEVIVPRHLNRSFTYLIPARLQTRIQVGSQVFVPFGPSTLHGVVVSISSHRSERGEPAHETGGLRERRLREIASLLDETADGALSPQLLHLTRLVAERYLAPWGQCIRLILPASPLATRSLRYALTESGRKSEGQSRRLSSTARELLKRLADAPNGLTLASLRRTITGPLTQTLSNLRRRGWVRATVPKPEEREGRPTKIGPPTTHGAVPARSLPLPGHHLEPAAVAPRLPLWWDRLRVALNTTRHAAFLLQAPSAIRSACLFQAAEETLARHRTVLIIVPEIVRASGIAARAEARWGSRVQLLHSGLPRAARAEIWRRIHSESVGVVVGTRSAVFAPLGSPGLIWVEDEEDPSLKEEEEPRYHAREVAWMRARQHDAVLVLESAHPSLETRAAMEPLNLDILVESAASPAIQTVDLRRLPHGALLSEPMIAGIGAALETRAGAVLFLNRKGFAPALLCRDCGVSPRCQRCSVALTFYRRAARLACHYCGASCPLPDTCSACGGARIEPVGFGTERVEEEIRRLFPHARIGRLDRDIARTPAQAEAIRRLAAGNELDILIGTQMLFQGPPLRRAGFVGIPHADAGLHLPDFRSAERTYHALLDAVALARPGDAGGKVVLQTYLPTHHAIAAVVTGNPALFHEQEAAFRNALGYPPFAHLINLRVSGKNLGRVREAAQQWAGMLIAASSREGAAVGSPTASKSATDDIIILGPIPSPVAQLRGRHRWQLLVKSGNAQAIRQAVRASLEELEREDGRGGLKFEVDVDPVEMV